MLIFSDYKLLPGSNKLWSNVAYGDPLPAISDCCVVPQWADTDYKVQTCGLPPPDPTCKYGPTGPRWRQW